MLEGMRFRWVTIFLDFPNNAFQPGVAFWREVTQSGLSPLRGAAAEFATLLPATGDAYLRVQRVGAGPGGCHLDLHVDPAAESLPAAAARAQAAGATVLHAEDGLVVASSPGGFPFCLVEWEGESLVPEPVQLGDTGASRADQLCLDIPAAGYDRECSFWTALTGVSPRTGARSEFTVLPRPEGIPVRLLLQRRSAAAPGDRVTGHVDIACADRRRLAGTHTGLGGRVLATFAHWIVLADPVGREYCLTGRDPRTGTLPGTPARSR
jgi:Glyoxalase-like domain